MVWGCSPGWGGRWPCLQWSKVAAALDVRWRMAGWKQSLDPEAVLFLYLFMAALLWCMGSVALQYVESSRIRDQTHVPWVHTQTLNHCTTMEVSWRVLNLNWILRAMREACRQILKISFACGQCPWPVWRGCSGEGNGGISELESDAWVNF